ncbi:MAG: calcium-binding protein, partial [Oscillatoriales cyanobacterium]
IVSNGALPAGTYFLRVSQFEGDTNYNLTLTSAPSP